MLGGLKSDWHRYRRVTKFFLKSYLERKERRKQLSKRFIYRIDIIRPRKWFKPLKDKFLTLRMVKIFYLTLKYKHFKNMAIASVKKDGSFENHFFLALEGRLLSFLYRTGFASNMFESLYYIKNGFVTLDKKIVTYPNNFVNIYTILSFHPYLKKRIYFNFFQRITFDKRSLFNPPRYMFVSY